MKPLTRASLADRIMDSLKGSVEMSWKQLYEATGKPTMSSLSYAVRMLEGAGKVERVPVIFSARCFKHEDRSRTARKMIRRKA